jgi:hypothetical protein
MGVCAAGIAGTLAASIADNNDVALTFGLITAAAVLCLLVASAVSPPGTAAGGRAAFDERQAARVEHLVEQLVADGAHEDAVRRLVGEAVRLGRGASETQEIPHIRPPDGR